MDVVRMVRKNNGELAADSTLAEPSDGDYPASGPTGFGEYSDEVGPPFHIGGDPVYELAAYDQCYPAVAFDGTNYLVVWHDYRSGSNYDIYGARVSVGGGVLDPVGIAISTAANGQYVPAVAFDGTNYLVVWTDDRSGSYSDIYGARVSVGGSVLDPVGIAISTVASGQSYPAVAFDGTNHLVVWHDHRSGSSYDIYGARVSVGGSVLDPAGIAISTAALSQYIPAVAFDGTNYLVVWENDRSRANDIYGARVSVGGSVLDPGGIAICTAAGFQYRPAVAFDGTNYLVVWWDDRSDTYDIYGARVSVGGGVLDPVGIAISTATGYQYVPAVAFDGTNYLVVWLDNRSGTYDTYGARVSVGGSVLDPVGIAISTAPNGESLPAVAFDGTNYLVVWQDNRSGSSYDIYGARVSVGGSVLDLVGIAISTEPNCDVSPTDLDFGTLALGESANLSFTITNTGGAPLTGTVTEACDHFSLVSGGGAYSIAPGGSRIVTVKFQPMAEGTHICTIETGSGLCADVSCVGVGSGGLPNTQGKWALHYAGAHNSKTNTCSFDAVDCIDMAVDAPSGLGRYDIYVVAVDVDRIAGTRYGLVCDGPLYFYGWTKCSDLEIPTVGWPGCGEDNAQTWSAERAGPHVTVGILDVYVYGSSTSLSVGPDSRVGFAEWCDGTQPEPLCYRPTSPKVFGKIGFGVPGYNPCSIVPVSLAGFEANATDDGILLEWSSTDVSGFSHFFVHRSAIARDGEYLKLDDDPVEGAGAGGGDYSYLDTDVIPGTLYYYKLEAVESGGGRVFFGPYPVLATGVKAEYWLGQNVPNPFTVGAGTTISYSVAKPGRVEIKILDVAGRLVNTLVAEAKLGRNVVVWDGKGSEGRHVSSGVYVYQLRVAGFTSQKKMLVVD